MPFDCSNLNVEDVFVLVKKNSVLGVDSNILWALKKNEKKRRPTFVPGKKEEVSQKRQNI